MRAHMLLTLNQAGFLSCLEPKQSGHAPHPSNVQQSSEAAPSRRLCLWAQKPQAISGQSSGPKNPQSFRGEGAVSLGLQSCVLWLHGSPGWLSIGGRQPQPAPCPCWAVSVCKGRQGPLRPLAQCVRHGNCQRWSGRVTAWGPWAATHSYLIKLAERPPFILAMDGDKGDS